MIATIQKYFRRWEDEIIGWASCAGFILFCAFGVTDGFGSQTATNVFEWVSGIFMIVGMILASIASRPAAIIYAILIIGWCTRTLS